MARGLFAAIAIAVYGCAAPVDEDPAEGAAAQSRSPRATMDAELPVLVVTVDDATKSWIAGEVSRVDGAVVGASTPRSRELYFRLQTAVNAKTIAPAAVHYGLVFSQQAEGRAITDAFSKAVDASAVPVLLESGSGSLDGTLYHLTALSDPPNMLVGEQIRLKCVDDACSAIDVPTKAENPLGWTLPHAFRAAATMASSRAPVARKKALDLADAALDGALLRVDVKRLDGARKISLKDLLTDPARAADAQGAVLVVAPPAAVPGSRGKPLPIPLDELKANVLRAAMRKGAGS